MSRTHPFATNLAVLNVHGRYCQPDMCDIVEGWIRLAESAGEVVLLASPTKYPATGNMNQRLGHLTSAYIEIASAVRLQVLWRSAALASTPCAHAVHRYKHPRSNAEKVILWNCKGCLASQPGIPVRLHECSRTGAIRLVIRLACELDGPGPRQRTRPCKEKDTH